jgi:site-specific recombinase XerD
VSDDERLSRAFLLPRFADFIALEQGLSPRTQEAYHRDLDRFTQYVTSRGAGAPHDVTARLLRE